MKKVTTQITYRVPEWHYCNLMGNAYGQPSKEKCRFCVKEGSTYRCALYNAVLPISDGVMVSKTRECQKATAGYKSVVEDVEAIEQIPTVDPKVLIKATLNNYTKMRKQLISQGYPANLADTLAQKYVLGG
jgi:hypothetical protein